MHKNRGFTLIELLVVLGVFGIVMGIAALNLRPLSGDLQAAANEVVGTFKQARARAMMTTTAHRVVPDASKDTLLVQSGPSCNTALPDSAWTTNQRLTRTLREGVKLNRVNWQVCYDSRGLAQSAPAFRVVDKNSNALRIRVFLGGSVRVTDVD